MKHKSLSVLIVALMSVLCLAGCKKQTTDSGNQLQAKAVQIYEQHKAALVTTKSANPQDVVKPMPGNFTPLWERAVEKQRENQTVTTVPINTDVAYRAVYPCAGHDAGAEHNHEAINVVQKLAVVDGANLAMCYVMNIVPYEGCELSAEAINDAFVYGEGMAGFSGFVAYHGFDGALMFMERYEDGARAETAQADDESLVSSIGRGAKLYIEQESAMPFTTKGYVRICDYCGVHCGYPYNAFQVYDPADAAQLIASKENQENLAKHCLSCHKLLKQHVKPGVNYCRCTTPGGVNKCTICGQNCGGICISPTVCLFCGGGCLAVVDYVHSTVLRTYFYGKISSTSLHSLQLNCCIADNPTYQTTEYLFMHNITFESNRSKSVNDLNSYFVNHVRSYKQGTVQALGSALHPILDAFLPMETRRNMLNFYTYEPLCGVINSSAFYLLSKETVLDRIYNSIQQLPSNPTDSQILQILDQLYEPLT